MIKIIFCIFFLAPCRKVCEQKHSPVCGTNDVTYPNNCELENAACEKFGLKLKHSGPCCKYASSGLLYFIGIELNVIHITHFAKIFL